MYALGHKVARNGFTVLNTVLNQSMVVLANKSDSEGPDKVFQALASSLWSVSKGALQFISREGMHKIGASTWSELQNKERLSQAVDTLDLVVQRGNYVNDSIFYGILKSCIEQKDLLLGSRVHALTVKCGYQSNSFLANHIICMYASHGRLEGAMAVFTEVAAPNRYVWGSIILAHARQGQPKEAIKLYRQMRDSKMKPNNHIFVAVLKACATAEDLCAGRKVHADILGNVDKPDMFVWNCLVDMYAKCGSLDDARKVFDNLPARDVVTWNCMIAGYGQLGLCDEALALYARMRKEGIGAANRVTFVSLLQACAKAGDLLEGKEIHSQIREQGLEADVITGNCLVNMYSKCGSLEDARRVFDNLPTKDVVTWNAMVAGYAKLGLAEETLALYGEMQRECTTPADAMTFVSLLHACGSEARLDKGKEIHAQISKLGLEFASPSVGNALIDMYSKCGSLEDARKVFNNVPARDVVTWTSMIAGYAQHDISQEALTLYASMHEEGITPADALTFVCLLQACGNVTGLEKGKEIHAEISAIGLEANLFVVNALIDMYGKCGSMVAAQQVFDASSTKDIVTWSALIAGYARQGESNLVFHLFRRLRKEGMQPNGITFLSVLTVCSHVGLVDRGQVYFQVMCNDYGISPTIEHYVCMVDLLGRANQIDKAMRLVETMPFQAPADVWRCVLGACQKWRNVDLARQAFENAVKVDKNDAAAYVLMANICAAANMLDEAKLIHAMRVDAGAWKEPGQSWWTGSGGIVHTFEVEDRQHSETQHIHANLGYLSVKMEEEV